MGHHFEEAHEAELDATPEQVWDAIATGPGIDSWLMGRNEVEPGTGGTVRMIYAGAKPEYTVTGWEPGKRLAYQSDEQPDGRFVAYEYLLEARDQGSTVLRLVTSGFIPGDGWEDEYVAMTAGGTLFFHNLVEYLTYFSGQFATPITLFGPQVDDWPTALGALASEIGASQPLAIGDRVRLEVDGAITDGVVYQLGARTMAVRTNDALYGFSQGFYGPMVATLHIFAEVDEPATEHAWRSWLDQAFSPSQERS